MKYDVTKYVEAWVDPAAWCLPLGIMYDNGSILIQVLCFTLVIHVIRG